jgi:hypothetical protein
VKNIRIGLSATTVVRGRVRSAAILNASGGKATIRRLSIVPALTS